ncbi:MAG: hypothetical protein LC130_30720, partial [Bryobacterales bacterium]|nr:hypothetical protein [Bryobacterales bacterium]
MRLFLNLENLTNVRQTRWNSLLRPNRAPDGRWTVDAWAPLDGRVINGGVRFLFATRVVRCQYRLKIPQSSGRKFPSP